jgi:sugar-specific transcriptional regulator TrmB
MSTDFSSQYRDILKLLGLSDYEIRVFIGLIENGSSNYSSIAKESKVPTGKIYQVLSALESKGFIEVSEGKPKQFTAVEPKKACRKRLRQMEDDYLDLENKIGDALQNLQFQYSQKYDRTQGIVTEVIVGSKAFENVIKQNLLKAKDEVLFSSSCELIARLNLEGILKDLRFRGVSINVLCQSFPASDKDVSNGVIEGLLGLDVNIRLSESVQSKYIVVDNQDVLLLVDGQEEETCIQILSSALCRVLREDFINTWVNGKILTQDPNNLAVNVKRTSKIRF